MLEENTFLLEADKLLLEATEPDLAYTADLEMEILERAKKNCESNARAWEANEKIGKGKTETNLAGAKKYWDMAAAIDKRLQELQLSRA